MGQWIPGVSGKVTAPITYTMQYFDGRRTYQEPFALINCSPAYVASVGGQVAAAIGSLNTIPVVGNALSFIIGAGASWYGAASLNADGSVTFMFSYHYCGTKAGGVDLTAWPLPGVAPNTWNATVNALISAINAVNGRTFADAAATRMADSDPADAEVTIALSGTTEGNIPNESAQN